MGKVVFFCIPAQGHTNPTLGVVRELINRGHQVFYYSYQQMRARIEETGAKFIPCDAYDPQIRLTPADAERLGKDLAFSTELLVDMTLALDDAVLQDMEALKPDVIVADSMAFWGKLMARKLGIPFVSSTTTFAFNRYSSKEIPSSGGSLLSLLRAMPRINKSLKRLRAKGYDVKNVLDIIANDNHTHTIVYTAPQFQPRAETFSDKYAFVGASMRPVKEPMEKVDVPTVYVSMGTVLGKREAFYRSCIEALRDLPSRVILSVGETDIADLGEIPAHIRVYPRVDQMAVLEGSDVFITHCGMNSVNEALYNGVPMILFPQTPEQGAVAHRTEALGAGVMPKKEDARSIRAALDAVLRDERYQKAAQKLSEDFKRCGGAAAAADKIGQFL